MNNFTSCANENVVFVCGGGAIDTSNDDSCDADTAAVEDKMAVTRAAVVVIEEEDEEEKEEEVANSGLAANVSLKLAMKYCRRS